MFCTTSKPNSKETTMKKPDYVYVTYIATTPEKAWKALSEVDLMRQWWVDPKAGCARVNVSDWQPGSDWQHQRADGSDIVDVQGKVVEFIPPRRMVLTWGRPDEANDLAKHSRLTIDVERYTDSLVRLTVTHDELDEAMLKGISGGWPTILSNLKTLLETGRPLPMAHAPH
jgi:uncharacterized protein YndB with AHSA1/START domain